MAPHLESVVHELPSGTCAPFDPDAEYFARRVAYDAERLGVLRSMCAAAPGREVLEVGASPYILTSALLADGFSLSVVGLPEGDVERGTARLTVDGVEHACPLVQVDVELEVPFDDEQFDLVVAGEIIEHFYRQPWHFIAEAWRCLKPGGLLVASTPNGQSLEQLYGWFRRSGTGHGFNPQAPSIRHAREYNPAEMRELLHSQGFDPVVTTRDFSHVTGYSGALGGVKRRVRSWLSGRAARTSGFLHDRGNTLLVAATKSTRPPGPPPSFMVYAMSAGGARSGWNFDVDETSEQ